MTLKKKEDVIMKKWVFLSLLAFFAVGCAGKFEYIKPSQSYKTSNTITINKPKDEVWKKIISSLGSSFFVINNIDKESGFINISYSGDPEKYIDCGVIDSYVKNAMGERRYHFPAASAYQEYETMVGGQNLLFYKRKMNLEGRINLIIQELSQDSTLVTVNIKYVVTKNILVSNPQGQSTNLSDSISFNTNGSATFPKGTSCYATGALEREVIDALGL